MTDDYTILRQRNPRPAEMPPFCQSGFFFNDAAHLCQQSSYPLYAVAALNRASRRAEARCSFFVTPGGAVSPAAAPFGSVEFTETLPDSVLDLVISQLIEAARSAGATTLRLVSFPACYAPVQTERLRVKLPEHGFDLVPSHSTFFLPVAADSFVRNLVSAERQRLRKCQRAGLQVVQWPSPNVDEVVHFIDRTRCQKGYPLTIAPERLAALLHGFPNQFRVFAVTDGAMLAALTVAVRVRDDILYNFLPASNPDYQTFSPMVMLTGGLYDYCRGQGIKLLDLGTSLDGNGQPKESLMRFKRNLGAQESPKLIFEKVL